MGYTTWFSGALKFNKPINDELKTYINNFSYIRHMKRDVDVIKDIDSDWVDHCFNGCLGTDGEYYIVNDDNFGQTKDLSILTFNAPGGDCPGLWCDWAIETEDGEDVLCWNGGEKFYDYVEWLEYLITHFFTPSGYLLDGEIEWQGEDPDDSGLIVVKDSNIKIGHVKITYNFD